MGGPPRYESVKSYDEEEQLGQPVDGGNSSNSLPSTIPIPFKDIRRLGEFLKYEPDGHTQVKKYVRIIRELEQEVPEHVLSLQGRIGKVYNDLYEFYDPTELDELLNAAQSVVTFDQFLIKVTSTLGADEHLPRRIIEKKDVNGCSSKECEMVGIVFLFAIIAIVILGVVAIIHF